MEKQNNKITEKEILKEKKIFDSLSLEKKLEFWDEKGIDWYLSEFPSEMDRVIFNKPHVFLSIDVVRNKQSKHINSQSEYSIINKWRLNHYFKDVPESNPEWVIAKCKEIITDNPQPLMYLEGELRIQEHLFEVIDSDIEENTANQHFFRLGFESVVKKTHIESDSLSQYFVNYIKDYCDGRICAYYIPFLKEEIKRIRQEEIKIARSPENSAILKKLKWNGSQKNLAELILELQNKGWILEIQLNDLKEQVNTICSLFDITETQKKKDSNPIQSLYQILKGEKTNDKREYTKIYSQRYKKNFDTIKKCAK